MSGADRLSHHQHESTMGEVMIIVLKGESISSSDLEGRLVLIAGAVKKISKAGWYGFFVKDDATFYMWADEGKTWIWS